MKAPMLESLLIKVQSSGLQFYWKETPVQVFPDIDNGKILKNSFFKEHFWWLFLRELRSHQKITNW